LNSLRVALVDDCSSIRRLLRTEIEHGTPFQVVGEACNGVEAVQLVKDQEPDVVVIDVSMPIMDGVEATRRIKTLYPHIHVFAFTNSEDEKDHADLASAGVTATVRKDRTAEYLVHMLWTCLMSGRRQETRLPAP